MNDQFDKRSLITGIAIGVVAMGCLWLIMGGKGRYQVSSGPRGTHVIDTRTSEVWIKVDSPDKWVSFGRANRWGE